MGRKSALTPEQWVEVERRHFIDGESMNSLAKKFGVNESVIRRKIKPNKAESPNAAKSLPALAMRKVEAEKQTRQIAEEIAELPISRQTIVNDLSRKLVNISSHLASAAEYGAATAHRLNALANGEVQKIDDTDPLASTESMRGVAALTSLANEAGKIGLNLLAANKEEVARMNQPESKAVLTLSDFYGGSQP